MLERAKIVASVALLLLLAACSDFFVSGNALVSIALTPNNASIQPGKTQQFTATGTFGDSSSKDISSQVTWKSGTPAVATISSGGLATGVATGSTTITATGSDNKTTGTTTLTVSTTVITSLAVSPGNSILRVGQTQQFTATATMSDGTTRDVTAQVTWASSNASVATISTSGVVTAVAAGSTNISATSGNIVNSTPLTVTLT